MTINLYLTHEDDRWSQTCQATIPGGWRGSTPAITFTVNGKRGDEYPLYGNTRQEVIDQVIAELKSRNLTGTLKVINA